MPVSITEILDDLRVADEITRRFERRYWLSSADFYAFYQQGRLDDGEHTEDYAQWAAFYEIKLDREAAPQNLSRVRAERLRTTAQGETIELDPDEPALPLAGWPACPFLPLRSDRDLPGATSPLDVEAL